MYVYSKPHLATGSFLRAVPDGGGRHFWVRLSGDDRSGEEFNIFTDTPEEAERLAAAINRVYAAEEREEAA